MATVGEVLKSARAALNLSQSEVAEAVKAKLGSSFSREALALIENGATRNPKGCNLQAVCDVLGVDFRSALRGVLLWLCDSKARDTVPDRSSRLVDLCGELTYAQQEEFLLALEKKAAENRSVLEEKRPIAR